jgi:sterol desaturase/sphingolipid hydroxylase (fatty acid hydroxylase superfamily)
MSFISLFYLAVIDYYLIQFLYYWFHRFIHLPQAGILYRMHYLGHHKRDFSIKCLRKTEYGLTSGNIGGGGSGGSGGSGGGGWFQTGGELVFGIPILLISIICYYMLSLQYFLVFEGVLLGNVVMGEVMHSSFHLTEDATNHPESLIIHRSLYAGNWFYFKYYQYMHDLHHAYQAANFGFFDLTMDRLFGTYNDKTPNYLAILQGK